MKDLLGAAKALLSDLASTLFFLILFLLTKNLVLSVGLGMALGVVQIGLRLVQRKPVDTMQWLSLFLVLASGAATLLTNDPRFIMAKPSVIYAIVGVVMLKPGWMNRYLPPIAMQIVPDIAFIFGYVWAALMFASAILNLLVAYWLDATAWAAVMSTWGIASKMALFLIQYICLRGIAKRRRRAAAVT